MRDSSAPQAGIKEDPPIHEEPQSSQDESGSESPDRANTPITQARVPMFTLSQNPQALDEDYACIVMGKFGST
jgi:hypothetical protein